MMKKIFFIFAVILVINQNMFSQNAEKKITIQSSPLLLFSDIFVADSDDSLFAVDLEGQFRITSNINFSLTLSFLYDNHAVDCYSDYEDDSDSDYYYRDNSHKENVYQANIKPMFVYRPFETGLRGFYLGFFPNVGFLYVETNPENLFFTEIGFGIDWGYKWIFRNGFTMQLGNGISKTFSIPEGSRQYISLNSDGRISVSHSTDIHLLDFKLGYSF